MAQSQLSLSLYSQGSIFTIGRLVNDPGAGLCSRPHMNQLCSAGRKQLHDGAERTVGPHIKSRLIPLCTICTKSAMERASCWGPRLLQPNILRVGLQDQRHTIVKLSCELAGFGRDAVGY